MYRNMINDLATDLRMQYAVMCLCAVATCDIAAATYRKRD